MADQRDRSRGGVKPALAAGLGLLAAACATAPGPSPAPGLPALAGDSLPPQALRPGECALFVWTATAPHRLVLFEAFGRGEALLRFEGRDVPLRPLSDASVIGGGGLALAYDSWPDGLRAELSGQAETVEGEGFELSRAVLRVMEHAGLTVMPVGGVGVCR
jgi:hypothetical protein